MMNDGNFLRLKPESRFSGGSAPRATSPKRECLALPDRLKKPGSYFTLVLPYYITGWIGVSLGMALRPLLNCGKTLSILSRFMLMKVMNCCGIILYVMLWLFGWALRAINLTETTIPLTWLNMPRASYSIL